LNYNKVLLENLEYYIQAWSPSLHKDIDCLENVQRRATKMVFGLKKLSYEQSLRRLNLTTLEKRRKRGDLIEMYKFLTQKENVDYKKFFQKKENHHRLRGHSSKVFVIPSVRTNLRKSFFSHRVLTAGTSYLRWLLMQTFKYDRFIKDMGN